MVEGFVKYESRIKSWLQGDAYRMQALQTALDLNLSDWCIAAGFVRNLVWDKQHGYEALTPLNDLDLIYFDAFNCEEKTDKEYESKLKTMDGNPWSVKNQARMHQRNDDAPYTSTTDAMSYWVEVETAVGARLTNNSEIEILAPFSLESLFNNSITINSKRKKLSDFNERIKNKNWLVNWPNLQVII